MRLWVTGFGPFGVVTANPSEELARRLASGVEGWDVSSFVLAVTYADALATPIPSCDLIVAMGLHGGDATIRLERNARRRVGETPDVMGEIGTADMLPPGPDVLSTSLFDDSMASEPIRWSDDAGAYLCNFCYYCLLAKTQTPAIFIHVPHSEVSGPKGPHIALDEQETLVRRCIADFGARI